MAWFRKEKKPKEAVEKQVAIPEGLWVKCDDCKEIVYRKEVEAEPQRLPEVRLPLPPQRARALRDPLR